MEKLEFAKKLASMMHCRQKYGSSTKPYTYHLERVEKVLARFGFDDEDFAVCAWLHDIIEDCLGVEYEHVREGFGEDIANVVFCVTNAVGRNRREKFKYTYPKMRENKRAVILKLADRIANVENGLENNSNRYAEMYTKEWPAFHEALFDAGETDDRVVKMWDFLKGLFEKGEE